MSFTVSARKYRPSVFETVVGQEHITLTLKNALLKKHLGQSFLFCGPRGVGKTTCARILAKAMNCDNLSAAGEPCNACPNCQSFNNHQSFNIYELDAASNNSVDDIRSLSEQVRFAPQMGRYKIYIIDEVHMLSAQAFNAFLKTLEEPPAHAVFILATTEKHKILPTILSRCQVFDFNRISVKDISSQLESIAQKENIKTEDEALYIIAQKADGAMRDALSIFDRIASFTNDVITYKDVITTLNILDYEYYFNIVNHLADGELSEVLLMYNDIINLGFDGHNFIDGLSTHIRNLLVCKDVNTLKLLEVSDGIRMRYAEQCAKTSMSFLLSSLSILNKADVNYKQSKNPRLHVELALMRISSLKNAVAFAEEEMGAAKKPVNYTGVKPVVAVVSKTAAVVEEEPRKKISEAPSLPSEKTTKLSPEEIRKEILRKKEEEARRKAEEYNGEITYGLIENPAAFLEAWKGFIDYLRKTNNDFLYNGLNAYPLEFTEGGSVKLRIENEVISKQFDAKKTEFIHYLMDKHNHPAVHVEFYLKPMDDEERGKKVFTAGDKFRRLAEINPELIKLKDALGLDISY